MDAAIQLFQETQKQRITNKLDVAIRMLLDLCTEAYGPRSAEEELSAADQLKVYAKEQPEACALLHGFGLATLLELPASDPQQLQRWADVRSGRKLRRARQ